MKISYYLCLLSIVWLASCSKKENVTIRGEFSGSPAGEYVLLAETGVASSKIIDSCRISSSGKIRFKVKPEHPSFYELRFPNKTSLMLLAEAGEKISFLASYDSLPLHYKVSGSKGSEYVQEINQTLSKTKNKLDSLRILYRESFQKGNQDSLLGKMEQEYAGVILAQRKAVIRFVISNYRSMASIMALYQKYNDSTWVLDSPRDLQYFKIVSDTLGKLYPKSNHVKALKNDLNNQLNLRQNLKLQALAKKAAVGFPEIKLTNEKGDTLSLSSLKGKVILLSFWVSNSPVCLVENREYLEVYKKYKNRGFEIYQVSLDNDRVTWLKAVYEHNYPWKNLFGGKEGGYYTLLYNVQNLPSNFIINKQGDLIARDIPGDQLEKNLKGLF